MVSVEDNFDNPVDTERLLKGARIVKRKRPESRKGNIETAGDKIEIAIENIVECAK